MEYLAKLDETKHVQTIYLPSQLTDTTGYVQFEVPDAWMDLFMQDWTNFYIKDDGSLDFDGNKATQTQQLIDSLEATNAQQAALNNQVLTSLVKLQSQFASK